MLFRLFIAALLLFGTSACFSQKKTVRIDVSYYQPYCGGARPTPEMQADAQKPRPYVKKTMILVSAAGKVDSVKTNASGALKLSLKPGTYRLFEPWRYYRLTPNSDTKDNYDTECLAYEWQLETYLVEVTAKTVKASEAHPILNNCGWNRPCVKSDRVQVPE